MLLLVRWCCDHADLMSSAINSPNSRIVSHFPDQPRRFNVKVWLIIIDYWKRNLFNLTDHHGHHFSTTNQSSVIRPVEIDLEHCYTNCYWFRNILVLLLLLSTRYEQKIEFAGKYFDMFLRQFLIAFFMWRTISWSNLWTSNWKGMNFSKRKITKKQSNATVEPLNCAHQNKPRVCLYSIKIELYVLKIWADRKMLLPIAIKQSNWTSYTWKHICGEGKVSYEFFG